ncbi:hypothetical protein BC567DRAFT_233269 [Phyllosticta citribraziliensis]
MPDPGSAGSARHLSRSISQSVIQPTSDGSRTAGVVSHPRTRIGGRPSSRRDGKPFFFPSLPAFLFGPPRAAQPAVDAYSPYTRQT